VTSSCDGNECLGFMKGREFLDELAACQKELCLMEFSRSFTVCIETSC
jgi:hypothetical protein